MTSNKKSEVGPEGSPTSPNWIRKYTNFFISNVNMFFGTSINFASIALPLGISFYTFQILSYVIDLYRGKVKLQKNFFYLLLYVSFFPQLIAGPIVRYADVAQMLEKCDMLAEKDKQIQTLLALLGK